MNQPAQGLISFSRVTGSADCFGCDIPLDGYIQLKVTTARVKQDIGREYYIPGDTIVRLRMTTFQFGEVITNLNHAGDIPCTLEVVGGKRVGKYEKRETTIDGFKDSITKLSNESFKIIESLEEQIEELSTAKTPSKKAIKKIKADIYTLHTRLKEDIPWLQSRFQEDMLVILGQMKKEASAWIQNKLIQFGLDKVKKLK